MKIKMKNILLLLLFISNFALGETIFEKFRAYAPEYSDVSDKKLKLAIYRKYYSGMRYEDFEKAINKKVPKDHKFNFPSKPLNIAHDSRDIEVNVNVNIEKSLIDPMIICRHTDTSTYCY